MGRPILIGLLCFSFSAACQSHPVFNCDRPEATCGDTPGAVCVDGRCAEPNPGCASGLEYADNAGDLAGECVTLDVPDASETDAATDASPSDASVIAHEKFLLLCKYDVPVPLSFSQYLSSPLFCGIDNFEPETACTIDSATKRPKETEYYVRPLANFGQDFTLEWADGSTLEGMQVVHCRRTATNLDDSLVASRILGTPLPGGGATDVLLSILYADPIEPAALYVVRASASLKLVNGRTVSADDLGLAIQYFDGSKWADASAKRFTTTGALQVFDVQATIPAGAAIRSVLTGRAGQTGSYELTDMRLRTEQE